MRSASNKKFKCSQPKTFFLYIYSSEKNETVHLQPYLLCLNNNQSKNGTKIIPKPIQPDKN